MLRRLAGPLRVIALLILVLMGNAGHHAAMAGGFEGYHGIATTHGHHDGGSTCEHGACGTSADQCCVMGQCLIGIAPDCGLDLLPATTPERIALKAAILSGGSPELPLRPPA